MKTVYKCPRCDAKVTVYVRLSEPPLCNHNHETGHRPSVMEETK